MKKNNKKQKCAICGEPIYGLVQVHHHNEDCPKCGQTIIGTHPHHCEKDNEIKGSNKPLKCVKKGCRKLQTAEGEYCEKHYPQKIKALKKKVARDAYAAGYNAGKKPKKIPLRERLYNALENLNDDQFLKFCGEWFGAERLWDDLRDSIESVEDSHVRDGLSILKGYERKPDQNDAEHPARKAAISIIENVIEPLLKKGLNGEKYYAVEDQITEAIADKIEPEGIDPEILKRAKKLVREIEEFADSSEPDRDTIEGEAYSILEAVLAQAKGKKPKEDPENEYLIIGSNNFWYSSRHGNLKDAKSEAKAILRGVGGYADPETGNTPEKPESVYIYKAKEVEQL